MQDATKKPPLKGLTPLKLSRGGFPRRSRSIPLLEGVRGGFRRKNHLNIQPSDHLNIQTFRHSDSKIICEGK
jgi:hypothetical protein